MALLEIRVVPVGRESTDSSSVVSQALHEAHRQGITYSVNPTSTVMEGELPALLQVAQQMHEAAFGESTERVVTNISIDERRERAQALPM